MLNLQNFNVVTLKTMALFTGVVLFDLIAIFIAIFAVIYANFLWNYQIWKRKNVPYFEPTFPFGNLQPLNKQVARGEDIFNIVAKAKKQGWNYFGLFLNGKSFFVPLDLEIVKSILTKDFSHFTDRGMYYNEKDDPLSANLFLVGGIKWRNLRTKLTPTFTSGKMRGMFQTLIDCSSLLENYLKQHNEKEPIDIKNALACFTTDIIGSCAFGLDCNSFKDPNSPFVKNGKRIFEQTTLQQVKNMITMTFPNLSRALRLKLVPENVAKFYYDIVTKTVEYREKNSYSRNDFLQLLINIRGNKDDQAKDNKETMTMDEIVAQCLVFFAAGFETSSTTMTFALYELSINPKIQEKVREELFRVLKKYDNKICYDSLKELEYMQQVLDETLRKYPPARFITRQCTEVYNIPNSNITLEKGTNVLIPIKNIHYDKNIYENSKEFNPENFNLENRNKRHQYAYIPFGEGPRICIGMRFGLMQSKVGLATILRNFQVFLNSRTKTPLEFNSKASISSIKGGLWLNLVKFKD